MARRPMPTWHDRITHDVEPSTRVEHDVRYRYAAPAIAGAKLWCDLGCGTGTAAAAALPEGFEGEILLVDVDADRLAAAAAELPAARTLRADLSDPADVATLAEELKGKGVVVTCFETIEHLETFVPLVEMLESLKTATVILSVPNDAFWAQDNPHHRTMWGEGAFAELRSLLPDGHAVASQVQLVGSAIAPDDDGRVPTHFLASWGGAAPAGVEELARADLDAQRDWVRRREADLSYYKAAYEQVRRERDELAARLEAPRQLPAASDGSSS